MNDFFNHLYVAFIFTLQSNRFALKVMFQPNASKFTIYNLYEKTHVVFCWFSFRSTLLFLHECLGPCQHRPGHSHREKVKLQKMKIE